MTLHQINSAPEKAILVGVVLPADNRWEVEENLSELKLLAQTSGVRIVDELMQERRQISPSHFIGKGKVQELTQMVKMHQVSTVIFDDDLSPAQVRNLEKAVEAKIVDRSALILDIFADHARTRAAKTQVELAQLQYLLPRLTRQWTHLSRQVGGIGTKGPGETQLETDRRLIRNRIESLQKALQKIDQQRITQRKGRKDSFQVSIIGYTNVGKSTIMNLFSDANVLVEDQLFATLDSTVRRVELDDQHQILLTDTVGFIRKLPHHLIAAFKSTLEETVEADLLLHVVDASYSGFEEQIKIVNQVLQDIGAGDKPILVVFNKIDLLKEKSTLQSIKQQYPDSVFISAIRQIRTEYLKRSLIQFIEQQFVEDEVKFPIRFSRLVNVLHSLAIVTKEKYTNANVTIRFRCTARTRTKILNIVDDTIRNSKEIVQMT